MFLQKKNPISLNLFKFNTHRALWALVVVKILYEKHVTPSKTAGLPRNNILPLRSVIALHIAPRYEKCQLCAISAKNARNNCIENRQSNWKSIFRHLQCSSSTCCLSIRYVYVSTYIRLPSPSHLDYPYTRLYIYRIRIVNNVNWGKRYTRRCSLWKILRQKVRTHKLATFDWSMCPAIWM